MRDRLSSLDESGMPIRVAIIGCGRFGGMMLAQIRLAPGMTVAVACDIDLERARHALDLGGYDDGSTVTSSTTSQANGAIHSGKTVATEDSSLAIDAEVDVVVEATGNPLVGARHALRAIENGKHVVMVNVEADVLVGPALKKKADEAGVVYSLAYGDQPAVIEELYDWAVSMGFEVVAAGKGTKYLPEYRHSTPDEALITYGYTPEEVAESGLNPKMYNSFLDGTKSAVEMCAVANMTGLLPDVPGMHFPPASIEEIPRLLVPKDEGGILSKKGVVEVVSSLRRDGSAVDNDLRWGVYVVINSESPYLRTCMVDYGMATDPSGRYAVMYRPYHLVGMEAPVSIARACLYGEATGASHTRVGEVVAAAKRNLNQGESLDGEGGYTVYGLLVEASQADAEDMLPIGLCHGATVTDAIGQDSTLTYADVELPEGGLLEELRAH